MVGTQSIPIELCLPTKDVEVPWTVAHPTPLSMEFSRQEYWSGLPCPPPENCPKLGIKPRSPALQADFLLSEPPRKPHSRYNQVKVRL